METTSFAVATIGLSILAAPFVTVALIRLLSARAEKINLVDLPEGRKDHGEPIPLVGGPAMFMAFALALLASGAWAPHYRGLLLAMALLTIVGIIDDRKHVRASLKLLAQTAAALLLVAGKELTIQHLGAIDGEGPVHLGFWSEAFTVVCVVGLINAINMLDGLDGLAGGSVAVMLLGLTAVAMLGGNPAAAVGPAVLCAALVGFLAFNLPGVRGPRPRIFMGDSGSMLLGLALAWFAIDIAFERGISVPPMVIAWILALPVIDTVVVISRRLLKRQHPMKPDHSHLHHALLRNEISTGTTVAVVLGIAAITGTIGIVGWKLGVSSSWLFGLFLVAGLLHWTVLAYVDRALSRPATNQTPDRAEARKIS